MSGYYRSIPRANSSQIGSICSELFFVLEAQFAWSEFWAGGLAVFWKA